MSALSFLEEAITDPPPSHDAPQSFVPSAAFAAGVR
jgi:hypothetical protein